MAVSVHSAAAISAFVIAQSLGAQDVSGGPTVYRPFNPETLPGALMWAAAFGLLGIVLAIFGFKLFDWVTPGNLQKEVFENKNMAAAILGAAILIGVCIILHAAIHG